MKRGIKITLFLLAVVAAVIGGYFLVKKPEGNLIKCHHNTVDNCPPELSCAEGCTICDEYSPKYKFWGVVSIKCDNQNKTWYYGEKSS